MKHSEPTGRFLLCLQNQGYLASLEVRKVYQSIDDPQAASRGLVRVIDESGDDYLFPTEFFVPIKLPRAATRAFAGAS